jgi:predicted transcriptional regulator
VEDDVQGEDDEVEGLTRRQRGVTLVSPEIRNHPLAGTTSIKLPESLKERVSAIAQGVAQTPHAYMVEAITEKVARDERRRDFLESARESAREFKRTGVAYALADVERYILAKAAGKRAAMPKPIKIPRPRR